MRTASCTCTSNNERLRSEGDNDLMSNAFALTQTQWVLCVGFSWQMVKTRVIILPGVEGQNPHDQTAFCAFHSFLMEVQTSAVHIHATHA